MSNPSRRVIRFPKIKKVMMYDGFKFVLENDTGVYRDRNKLNITESTTSICNRVVKKYVIYSPDWEIFTDELVELPKQPYSNLPSCLAYTPIQKVCNISQYRFEPQACFMGTDKAVPIQEASDVLVEMV